MRLAVVGCWCLIVMLLARILVPTATAYLAPGTIAARESWRLIEFTADASAVMLLVALAMLVAIKFQWRRGMWLSLACSSGILILSVTSFINVFSTRERPLVTSGSLLLPPLPEATSFSESVVQGLGNFGLSDNLSTLLMILSLLLPSLVLVIGLWKSLRGPKGATQ